MKHILNWSKFFQKKHFFVFFFHILVHVGSFAQDSLHRDLDEVIVVGNKFDKKRRDSPYVIETIKASKIKTMNSPNTATLLEQSGEAFVQRSQGGGGSPVLRGFEANKILLVVDGVRMNNAIYRGGHLQNILRVDQNILENVEILQGPGSIIYGSDALGGVIHMKTKDPVLNKTSGNAFLRLGTAAQEKSGHLDFAIGKNKWGFLTSLSFSDFGDVTMGSRFPSKYPDFGKKTFEIGQINGVDEILPNDKPYIQKPTAYSQHDLLQKIMCQTHKSKHTLNVQYSGSSDVPRYDRLTEMANATTPRYAEWYYGPEKRLMSQYKFENSKKNTWYDNLSISLANQNIVESRVSRRFRNANRKSQIENVAVQSVNLDFLKNTRHGQWSYGLESTLNQVYSKATFTQIQTGTITPADTRYPDGGSSMNTFSGYLTSKVDLNPWASIHSGLRQNFSIINAKFSEKTFFPFPFENIRQYNQATTGSLALNLIPGTNTHAALLVSSAYRSPNIDDLTKVFESTAGRLVVPNATLKPEYSRNYEANIQQKIGIIKLEAAAYISKVSNIIAVGNFQYNQQEFIDYQGVRSRIVASQNLGNAQIKGLSFRLKTNSFYGFDAQASINKTIGRLADGSNLDHIPPAYGQMAINYVHGRINMSLYDVFNAAKPLSEYSSSGEDNQIYATPEGSLAWHTLNFKSTISVTKNFDVQVGVDNIFDQNYRVFASGISGMGRNFTLCLRAKI